MRLRYTILAIISALMALGCFRLSKWQADRLAQRRERNAMLAGRLAEPPAPLAAIPGDTTEGHYRRVAAAGVFDYDREFALALRSRDGSPGVYTLTPLRLRDGSTVLANRGWIYAADGMSVDLARWREADSVTVEGFLETYVEPRGPVTIPERPHLIRRLVRDSLLSRVAPEATLSHYILVVTTPLRDGPAAPARLTPPALNEGSHLSYAIQWAAFGVIALAGTALALRRGFSSRRSDVVATSTAQG